MAKKKKRGQQPDRRKEPPPARNPHQLASMADFWPAPVLGTPAKSGRDKVGRQEVPAAGGAGISSRPAPRPESGVTAAKPPRQHFTARREIPSVASKPEPAQRVDRVTSPPAEGLSAANPERRERYRMIIEGRQGAKIHRPIDVFLGIDLGTSFSKVVWRMRDNAYPVCFGSRRGSLADYLVPSLVAFDGKSFVTGMDTKMIQDSDVACRIPNFKMCLACVCVPDSPCAPPACGLSNWTLALSALPTNSEAVRVVNALFLGKLISQTRRIILKELADQGVAGQVRWSANLAVPEKYMDQSPVLDGFERVLRTAWLMADVMDEYGGLSSLEDVLDCYECAKSLESDGRRLDCFVYPEVGAEVASVTLSRSAKEGFYAFVDVGAGTVDASVFNLQRNYGEHNHNTYAAEVFKSGAAHVEANAGHKLTRTAVSWLKGMKEGGLDLDVASRRAEELLKPFLSEALEETKRRVRSELITLFKEAYDKYAGECNWEEIHLVLGGGGAGLPAYRDAAIEAFSLKNRPVGSNITTVDLKVPDDFRRGGLSAGAFHRFAVAYGLSFRPVDLPQLVLASEVKPLAPGQAGRKRPPVIDPTKDD